MTVQTREVLRGDSPLGENFVHTEQGPSYHVEPANPERARRRERLTRIIGMVGLYSAVGAALLVTQKMYYYFRPPQE